MISLSFFMSVYLMINVIILDKMMKTKGINLSAMIHIMSERYDVKEDLVENVVIIELMLLAALILLIVKSYQFYMKHIR